MTAETLKTLFENIIDDQLDTDFTYQLMNIAKQKIELERDWAWLVVEDSSKTRSSGDTFTTMKALPTDFLRPLDLFVETIGPYTPIPFTRRRAYQYQSLVYYLDYKNSQFALCGSAGGAGTIYFNYIYKTTDFTAANAATTSPVWPVAHEYLAYKMAEIFLGGTDPDSISIRMSQKDQLVAEELYRLLIEHDAALRGHAMDFSAAPPNDGVNTMPSSETLGRM